MKSASYNRHANPSRVRFRDQQLPDRIIAPLSQKRSMNRQIVILAFLVQSSVGLVIAHAQQQPTKVFRIGYLDVSTPSGSAVLLEAFRQELNKFGWIEGKNITIEYRFAEGKTDRLPDLAADLVHLKVDVRTKQTL